MSKTYYIRVNCVGFHDFTVIAKNKREAELEAVKHFQCDSTEGSADEYLQKDEVLNDDVIENGIYQ